MISQNDLYSVLFALTVGLLLAGNHQPVTSEPATKPEPESSSISPANEGIALDQLVALALQENPRVAKASFAVLVARGRAMQAGLYPNPNVGVTFDELFDRTGRGGVNSLPLVSQEVVTAGKLQLSREAGLREVDQATWQVMGQRYELLSRVRTSFFDALALQARIDILRRMLKLAEQSAERSGQLLAAKQVARLDLIQLEVEVERLRAELESSERELPGAYKRLAAAMGVNNLAIDSVTGQLDQALPEYELEPLQAFVLTAHPDVQSAQFGVERARVLIARAKVEPIPNVTIDSGYVRQNQNRSDDFRIGANLSIPLWNKNQGNIRAAEAHYCEAAQQVRQVQNELTEQLAEAMRDFAASRRRSERYRTAILPRAKETFMLSRQAYQGGEFENLRVLESQRAFAQAYLEYIRALGAAWQAAAKISGLTLEEEWPPTSTATVPPIPEN